MTTVSKQKKVKDVKQKLKLFRANEPLKSVLMWGVNYSFSTLNDVKPPAILLKNDHKAYMKVKIHNYLFNEECMPSRFKFKEYCPMVFSNLRDRFNVNKFDYWDAFTARQPIWDDARGKSGSKFLVTYNRQFVAKTLSSEEVEQMHQVLEEYYAYIVHCRGQTLLPHYLGLYRLKANDQETYVLVMRNVFSPRLPIHKKYDLKGHVVERDANDREKSKLIPTLKENDFLNDFCKIRIGSDARNKLLTMLESDIQFLQRNNLMDYSLLIGIHEVGLSDDSAGSVDAVNTTGAEQELGSFDERAASAGDGMGSLASRWQLRQFSIGRRTFFDTYLSSPSGVHCGGNVSPGDEDYDEECGQLVDTGIPSSGAAGSLTPPDSPDDQAELREMSSDDLHPYKEFYGFKSSSDSPRQLVYFIAIIDALNKGGARKRPSQSVKHSTNADVSTVKPDLYGRRLLDFMSQCTV